MIQLRSILNVADNSGARKVQCFKVRGGHHRDIATLGDVVMCSVRDAIPTSAIKKGDVVRAVVVRVAREKDVKTVPISALMTTPFASLTIMANLKARVCLALLRENCGKRTSLKSSLWPPR